MSSLLVISPAPATLADGTLLLDIKYVEGMRTYSALWDGPVHGLLQLRDGAFPFARAEDPARLPFGLTLLPRGRDIGAEDIAPHDVILCDGDHHAHLHLGEICRRAGKRIVFTIEYIPETRRQILFLEPYRGVARKLRSLLWTMRQERRRRRAFRLAHGLQANGYPAFAQYRALNANTMMYLDNRIGEGLVASAAEMAARRRRITGGAPLRLVHSGRLEPMKGSQDLLPVALRLAERGVAFTLDIFGAGRLEDDMRAAIEAQGLGQRVRLHAPVDFETGLVPHVRRNADIYLSCHRQSDPSCTYIESMGCGTAVVGYANRMWSALCRASGAGWTAPLGDPAAIADAVAAAAADRQRLAACCEAAWHFARQHGFEREFHARIQHLKALA